MEQLQTLNGEAAFENVNEASSTAWKRGTLVIGAILLVAGLTGIAMGKINSGNKAEQDDTELESSLASRTFEFTRTEVESKPPLPEVVETKPALPPRAARRTTSHRAAPPRPVIDQSAGSAIVEIQQPQAYQVQTAQASTQSGAFGPSDEYRSSEQSSTGGTGLAGALQTTELEGYSAIELAHPEYMLSPGQSVDCTLATAIVTSVEGMIVCSAMRDIYSTEGSNILIAAGSRMTGQYSTATYQGSAKVFAVINSVETRTLDGRTVVAQLDSPVAGPMGDSGITGTVNTHFMQRFGGALLTAIVSDVASAAANRGDNNADVIIGTTAQTSNDLALEILRSSIGMKPTVSVPFGTPIKVMIARQVDFSGVLM